MNHWIDVQTIYSSELEHVPFAFTMLPYLMNTIGFLHLTDVEYWFIEGDAKNKNSTSLKKFVDK